MQLISDYQQFIINMINEYEKLQTNVIAPLHYDVFYSIRNNPIRFHDYKMLLHYFHGQNRIIQKYLIDPIFIYGKDEHERSIIMNTIYAGYKFKYKTEPALNQKIMYKEYVYILEKPMCLEHTTKESEVCILPLSMIINLVLTSESQKEFQDKYKFELENLTCKSSTNSICGNIKPEYEKYNYIIPQNLPNCEFISKIFSKGYRHSWNLLIEYVINNIQFLSNTRTIPKNFRYKNENIGSVYANLCKQLSGNSQYRPFKFDFIEVVSQLGLQFNDIDMNDLISASQFRT